MITSDHSPPAGVKLSLRTHQGTVVAQITSLRAVLGQMAHQLTCRRAGGLGAEPIVAQLN